MPAKAESEAQGKGLSGLETVVGLEVMTEDVRTGIRSESWREGSRAAMLKLHSPNDVVLLFIRACVGRAIL